MEIITIEFNNNKVRQLLSNLEELRLIKVVKLPEDLSKSPEKQMKSRKKKELGNLLASVTLKKNYSGLDSRAALDKLRHYKNG